MLHFITLIVLMITVAFTLLVIDYTKSKPYNFSLSYWWENTLLITIDLGLIYIVIR